LAALFIEAGVEGSRVNGKSESKSQLDLLEIRRQFIELRSLHSNNRRVASKINNLIAEIAHLHQPDNRAHEKHLLNTIAKTRRAIERILSRDKPAGASPEVNPQSFPQE
jgi:hypothetical protein